MIFQILKTTIDLEYDASSLKPIFMATKKVTTTTKSKAPKKKISEEDIRLRAEKIYHERLARGRSGDHLSDWLQAEKEIIETV